MELNELLDFLIESTDYNINMHDVSGIFENEIFKIDSRYRIHEMEYCNIVKSTPDGYALCTRCKVVVCRAAIKKHDGFFGMCPYGLFEYVYPVFVADRPVCVIFIGNTTESVGNTAEKARAACCKTGVSYKNLAAHFSDVRTAKRKTMYQTAHIIAEFIRMKCQTQRQSIIFERKHSAVSGIMQHIDAHYNNPLELGKLSAMYFVNEKYAGRLFLRQVGCTFHQYLTRRRLEAAVLWLENSEKSITEIALECGFGTASYLNRLFRRKYGVTPSEYRKKFKS